MRRRGTPPPVLPAEAPLAHVLAVHRTPRAENGQVVVARLDDDVTVKRFRQRGSIVRLIAENPAYEPIRVDLREQDLHIEGLAVGVLRKEIN